MDTKKPTKKPTKAETESLLPSSEESSGTNEANTQSQLPEEASTNEAESTDTSEETHEQAQNDVASNGKAIIYAGVVLVRNKTPKPICLSPIQLGIIATITIQSGEVVALPHKYARSLIMQNCFEQVSGTLVFHEAK